MFTFPVSHHDLFKERTAPFRAWGIPESLIDEARGKITSVWDSGPGGWCFEWMKIAEREASADRFMRASLLYGAARFPWISTPDRKEAFREEIHCFLIAARKFPFRFERREFLVGGKRLPVHLYSRAPGSDRKGVLFLTGGVDTHKVQLHRMCLALGLVLGHTLCAFDMPGTGENPFPLRSDSEWVYAQLMDQVQAALDSPRRGIMGMSFGAHWAAKLGLMGKVDYAIDLGGPVGASPLDRLYFQALPSSMPGIVANAMELPAMPADDELDRLLQDFSLKKQGLLEASNPAPILAINGDDDPYVPPKETLCFERIRGCEALLVRGSTHCAAERIKEVVPYLALWISARGHPGQPAMMKRLALAGYRKLLV